MKKVAFILYTSGLEYDDRIRKEALSISKDLNIEIFALTPNNFKTKGITSYGIKFHLLSLFSRKYLPSGKFTLLKSIEFYFQVIKLVKNFDVLWVHDVEPFLVPFLVRGKKLIWDLHELPDVSQSSKLEKYIFKKVFKQIEKKSICVIHANKFRYNYLIEKEYIDYQEKHIVIRNYCDNLFIESRIIDSGLEAFQNWLGNSEYIYLQGLVGQERYPLETIEAIIIHNKFKAIVVGSFDAIIKERLLAKYGDKLFERIYFRGKVDQMAIPCYIKQSKFSIIFYSSTPANNKFCEPNRMYQSIAFDKPVIVGANISMVELVDKYQFGVILPSYGESINDIINGIYELELNYESYIKNLNQYKSNLNWNNQQKVLDDIVNRTKI